MPKHGQTPDYGAVIADKAFEQTARKVHRVYSQAAKELQGKLKDFNKHHAAKQKEMLKKLNNGEITKAAYDSWMRGQVFIGKQWRDKVDSVVRTIGTANEQSASIVQSGRMNVFAENYNYAAYQLEKRTNGVVSFNIYDEKTVGRLISSKPQMLPKWKIDQEKDYKWNRQKVENVVTQGIIQGKGIGEITDDLVNNLCTTNDNKMRTFARTAMTGAQNAGRQAQMEDAEEQGIEVKKRWVATLDDRTRDTHQRLDGQEVGINEDFQIDDYSIAYPGDPNADAEMVYNCRCTMIEVYPGIDRKTVRRAYDEPDEKGHRESYTVENMTYSEWKEWKENGKPERETTPNEEQKEEPKQQEGPKTLVVDDDKKIEQDREYNAERDRQIDEYSREYDEAYRNETASRRELFDLSHELSDGKITQEEYDKRRSDIIANREESRKKGEDANRQKMALVNEKMTTFNSADLVDYADGHNVEYRPPEIMEQTPQTEEIVERLGGGDMTEGSCASLGFAYIGQQEGYDVLDFRGGQSEDMFARNARKVMEGISKETKKPVLKAETKTGTGGAIKLARQMEQGKEYYFITGRHAAITRNNGGTIEYMELQSARSNGWKQLGESSDRGTLDRMFRWRFGSSNGISGKAMMMDVNDMKGSKMIQRVYGYINTAVDAQKKGMAGSVK